MRTTRSQKPIVKPIEKMTVPQLQDQLEKNLKTLSNPSLFASSSTAPPDPLQTRLLLTNSKIRARLEEIQAVEAVTSQLSSTGLDNQQIRNGVPSTTSVTTATIAMNGNVDAGNGIVHWESAKDQAIAKQKAADEEDKEVQMGKIKVISSSKSTRLEVTEAIKEAARKASARELIPEGGLAGYGGVGKFSDELGEIGKAARLHSFLHSGLMSNQDEDDDMWPSSDDEEDEDDGFSSNSEAHSDHEVIQNQTQANTLANANVNGLSGIGSGSGGLEAAVEPEEWDEVMRTAPGTGTGTPVSEVVVGGGVQIIINSTESGESSTSESLSIGIGKGVRFAPTQVEALTPEEQAAASAALEGQGVIDMDIDEIGELIKVDLEKAAAGSGVVGGEEGLKVPGVGVGR